MFRDRDVTDPRNKIYSLLGLLNKKIGSKDESNGVIEVAKEFNIEQLLIDYNAEAEDVYASLVKAMVQGVESLNIICACQNPSSFIRSWVPDWSQPWSSASLLTNNIYSNMNNFIRPENTIKRYHVSANKFPLVIFSKGLAIMTARGIAWAGIAYLINRPLLSPYPNIVHWVNDVFENLNEETRELLSSIYAKSSPTCSISTKGQFIIACLAGNCNEIESRAWDYRYFYLGARVSWHDIARSSEGGGIEVNGRPAGFVEARHAQMSGGRQIFISENGYCGLVPNHAKVGDLLCVLFGCDAPVVLRPIDDCFTLIGEYYVHHLMEGKAIESLGRTKYLNGTLKSVDISHHCHRV